MKHISRLLISVGFIFCLCTGLSFAQTLADAARQAEAKKKTQTTTGHVYTNDSLEFHSAAPAPATATTKTDDAAKTDDSAAAGAAKTEGAADAPMSDDDKKKAAD